MFTLYVPLYESDERTVKSELATFFEAFPYGTRVGQHDERAGLRHGVHGAGGAAEDRSGRDRAAPAPARLRAGGGIAARNLRVRAASFFATYTGQSSDLGAWTKGADINRDRDLKLMYLAGWGINSSMADGIYRQMLSFRRMDQHPFKGSKATMDSLMSGIEYVSGRGD